MKNENELVSTAMTIISNDFNDPCFTINYYNSNNKVKNKKKRFSIRMMSHLTVKRKLFGRFMLFNKFNFTEGNLILQNG